MITILIYLVHKVLYPTRSSAYISAMAIVLYYSRNPDDTVWRSVRSTTYTVDLLRYPSSRDHQNAVPEFPNPMPQHTVWTQPITIVFQYTSM